MYSSLRALCSVQDKPTFWVTKMSQAQPSLGRGWLIPTCTGLSITHTHDDNVYNMFLEETKNFLVENPFCVCALKAIPFLPAVLSV
jgi:hypothetical protein